MLAARSLFLNKYYFNSGSITALKSDLVLIMGLLLVIVLFLLFIIVSYSSLIVYYEPVK